VCFQSPERRSCCARRAVAPTCPQSRSTLEPCAGPLCCSEREYVEHLAAHGVRLREAAAAPMLNAVLGADRKVRRGVSGLCVAWLGGWVG
jgi:hypothetical protein